MYIYIHIIYITFYGNGPGLARPSLQVLFLCTCNQLDTIDRPLLDRMEVSRSRGPNGLLFVTALPTCEKDDSYEAAFGTIDEQNSGCEWL